MAESSANTHEGERSGRQLKLCAFDGDVIKGALLKTSELSAPIRLLMTTQNDKFFTVVRPAHATAGPNLPEIFGVNHVEPLRRHFPVRALF